MAISALCCSSESSRTGKPFGVTAAWAIVAIAGAIILTLGALSIASLNHGNLGGVREITLKAAKMFGSSPLLLPVIITAFGGSLIVGAWLGYGQADNKNDEL